MSKKEEKSLVPVKKNTLPVPVKKGELKTPFSLVDETIYLSNRKDVQSILTLLKNRIGCEQNLRNKVIYKSRFCISISTILEV